MHNVANSAAKAMGLLGGRKPSPSPSKAKKSTQKCVQMTTIQTAQINAPPALVPTAATWSYSAIDFSPQACQTPHGTPSPTPSVLQGRPRHAVLRTVRHACRHAFHPAIPHQLQQLIKPTGRHSNFKTSHYVSPNPSMSVHTAEEI